MRIIAETTEFQLDVETAVAIGKFDGIHRGHRKLLEELLEQKKKGLSACVFTFDPAPAVFFGQSCGEELTTREEKRRIFEQLGVDILIEFPMTEETAGILPKNFVSEILAGKMNVRFVAAGSDLSFGRGGKGNAALLGTMGPKLGFEVKVIDKIAFQGIEVASTYIRSLVEEGRMEEAGAFLGSPYCVSGKVVHGNRIGRTLGFPTVNLLPEKDKLLPPKGVYYSQVLVGTEKYRAITNIGCKPTVASDCIMGVESYLYDFSREIYEEEIRVLLYHFKRPEQKFESLEELRRQLEEDIEEGKRFFLLRNLKEIPGSS